MSNNEIDIDDLDEYDDIEDDIEDDVEDDERPAKLNRQQRRRIEKRRNLVPAHAPEPQDHKNPKPPKSVIEVEANNDGDEMIPIEHDGEVYHIPADPDDWPGMALYYFENDKAFSALKELLDGNGWDRLAAKNYKTREFTKIFEKVAEAMGFASAGN